MSQPIDIGTLTATIEASVKGFDKALDGMKAMLDKFVADTNKAFDRIPENLGKQVKRAAQTAATESEKELDKVIQIRQQLLAREKKLSMDATQYQIYQLQQQRQNMQAMIESTISDKKRQASLIKQLEKTVSMEIRAIQQGALNQQAEDERRQGQTIYTIRKQLLTDLNKILLDEYALERFMANQQYDERRKRIVREVKDEESKSALLRQLGELHAAKMADIKKREDAERAKSEQDYATRVKNIEANLLETAKRFALDETQFKLFQLEKQYEAKRDEINKEIKEEQRRIAALKQLDENYANERKNITSNQNSNPSNPSNPFGRAGTIRSGVANVGMASGVIEAGLLVDITKSMETARQFDEDMRNVDSIALLTRDQLAKVNKEILDMTELIPKSADDMAKAFYDIQSSGFAGDQALDVLKISSEGAAAGLSTTKEAARALMGLMNAYNTKEGPDAIRIMDILFQTVKDGVVTFPELAQHISMVSAAAATSGIPLEEVGAAISSLTVAGMPAAQAIQTLNMLIHKMTTPTVEGSQAAKNYGLAWFDASQALQHIKKVGFAEALREIGAAAQGNKARFEQMIGDQEGARGAMILARNSAEDYTRFLNNARNSTGAMQEALSRQAAGFNVSIQFMVNALDRLRISLGDRMLGMLTIFIDAITMLAKAFVRLPGIVQDFTAAALLAATALTGLMTIGAGVGFVLFGINAGLLAATPLLVDMGLIAEGTTITIATLAEALWALLAPIALVGIQVGAVAVTAFAVWKLNLGGIADYTAEFVDTVSYLWGLLFNSTQKGNKQIAEDNTSVWSYIGNFIANTMLVVDKMVGAGLKLVSDFFRFWGAVWTGDWQIVWTTIKEILREDLGFLYDFSVDIFNDLLVLYGKSTDAMAKMVAGLGNVLRDPKNAQAGIDQIKQGWADAQKAVGDATSAIGTHVRKAGTSFSISMEKMFNQSQEMRGRLADLFGGRDFKEVHLPAAILPKTRGIEQGDGVEAYSDRQLRRDIINIKQRAIAEKMSHQDIIKMYEDLLKAHQLSGTQRIRIQKEIALQEAKIQREGTAAERKALAEQRKARAAALRAQHAEERRLSDAFKQELADREAAVKGFHRRTFDERKAALEKELQLLQGLKGKAVTAADRRELTNRIGTVQGNLRALSDERDNATSKLDDYTDAGKAKRLGDSLDDRILQIRRAFQKEIEEAQKHGVALQAINRAKAERDLEIAKAVADEKDKLEDKLAEVQGESLERRLKKSDDYYNHEIELHKGHKDQIELLEQTRDAKHQQIIEEHNEKTFGIWQAGLNKTFAFLSSMVDGSKNIWDRLAAGLNMVVEVFQKQIANVVVPYLDKVSAAFAKGGMEAVSSLIGGWTDVGIAAVQAAAKAAVAWAVSLGPAGLIVAGIAAAIVAVAGLGLAINAALGAANEQAKEFHKKSKEFAEDVEAINAGSSSNKVRKANSDYVQSLRKNQDDEVVKDLNWKLYNKKVELNNANSASDANTPAGQFKAQQLVKEINQLTILYQERLGALDKASYQKLQDDLEQITRESVKSRFQFEIDVMTNLGDKKAALANQQAKAQYEAEKQIEDDFRNGLIQDEAEKEERLGRLRSSLARKFAQERADIELEMQKKVYDYQIQMAEDNHDDRGVAELTRMKERAEVMAEYDKARADGVITNSQYVDMVHARLAALDQKYAASTADAWEKAFNREQGFAEDLYEMRTSTSRMKLESDLANNRITIQQYADMNAQLDTQDQKHAVEQVQAEIDKYTAMLGIADLGADKRLEIEQKLTASIKKLSADGMASLKSQIEKYTKSVEEKYQTIQDRLQAQKDSLEAQRDLEKRGHEDRLRELEAEARPLERQLDLINQITQALKNQYDEKRLEVNNTDHEKFNEALSGINLGEVDSANIAKVLDLKQQLRDAVASDREGQADMIRTELAYYEALSFEQIDAARKAADNQLQLENISAEEYGKIATALALKKAKLAENELKDTKISAAEKARIEGVLADAYTDWRNIQLQVLDLQEKRETDVLNGQAQVLKGQLYSIQTQQTAIKTALEDIDLKYTTLITEIDRKIADNKTNWLTALEAIKTRTDENVKAMIKNWDAVTTSINKAVSAALYLQAIQAGGGYYGSGGTGSDVATRGAGGGAGGYRAYATGGYIRGGKKGVDSVPIVAQDGEYVTDVSLTKGLEQMVSYFSSMARGAQYTTIGGTRVIQNNITIRDNVVRDDSDLDAIVEKVKYEIAREY